MTNRKRQMTTNVTKMHVKTTSNGSIKDSLTMMRNQNISRRRDVKLIFYSSNILPSTSNPFKLLPCLRKSLRIWKKKILWLDLALFWLIQVFISTQNMKLKFLLVFMKSFPVFSASCQTKSKLHSFRSELNSTSTQISICLMTILKNSPRRLTSHQRTLQFKLVMLKMKPKTRNQTLRKKLLMKTEILIVKVILIMKVQLMRELLKKLVMIKLMIKPIQWK